MKRILAVVLAALTVLSLVTVGVYADTDEVTAATAEELSAAVTKLSSTGGTIRLTSDMLIAKELSLPQHAKPITLNGDGHSILIKNNLKIGGDLTLENLTFIVSAKGMAIYCGGHTVHIRDSVTCKSMSDAGWLLLVAGTSGSTRYSGGSLTVDGGTWRSVYGGNYAAVASSYTQSLTINGGTFTEAVVLAGACPALSGTKVDATVNGGTFKRGITCFAPGDNSVYADCTLTVNGGTVYGWIKVCEEDGLRGRLSGNTVLNINGGDLAYCSGIRTSDRSSMTATVNFSKEAALGGVGTAAATDTVTGTLLRGSAADPWLFEHNGWYYLVVTGGTTVRMYKSRTISGLKELDKNLESDYEIIYTFNPGLTTDIGMTQCAGTWSPEIHYYSEEDFPGNSGWYLNLALNTGNNNINGSVNVRMVVLKSVSGDPEGPYGNPITGVLNDPELVVYDENGDGRGQKYAEWALGQTVMRVPGAEYGGIYALWVEEVGRGTPGFYQKIMTAKMLNPWTFTGKIGIVTTPTQGWEKIGSGYMNGKYYPMVVEGATPVYGENGELFLTYSGSGYWSNYGLGQLTWNGGDPTETASWVKYALNPIFSANAASGTHYDGVNLQGLGHASFFTDSLGNGYICYHAYPYNAGSVRKTIDGFKLDPGKKASSRSSYVESYYVDYTLSNGYSMGVVRVGDGSGMPQDNSRDVQTFALDTGVRYPSELLIGVTKTYTVPGVTTVQTDLDLGGYVPYIGGEKTALVALTNGAVLYDSTLGDFTVTGKRGEDVVDLKIEGGKLTVLRDTASEKTDTEQKPAETGGMVTFSTVLDLTGYTAYIGDKPTVAVTLSKNAVSVAETVGTAIVEARKDDTVVVLLCTKEAVRPLLRLSRSAASDQNDRRTYTATLELLAAELQLEECGMLVSYDSYVPRYTVPVPAPHLARLKYAAYTAGGSDARKVSGSTSTYKITLANLTTAAIRNSEETVSYAVFTWNGTRYVVHTK